MDRLLLHACCGPCMIMPAMTLSSEGFELLAFFMNPNIQPLAEFLRRREAVGQCADRLNVPILYDDNWNVVSWLEAQLPFANARNRCERCCGSRLEATAKMAQTMGISHFSTTLLYSRYQPHEAIRQRGEELACEYGLQFIYRDFRQYWQEGITISKEWGIYRQPYCGCIFSEAERYAKRLLALQKPL